jgi:hypothetical protein
VRRRARPGLGEPKDEPKEEWQHASLLAAIVRPAVNRLKKLIVPIVTPEAVILWTGLLVIVIVVAVQHIGGAVLQADMRNWFGQLSEPIRIAIFSGVGVTLWLLAFTAVSRIAARLRYAFDPAYEIQRRKRRWVQQLRIGDRLRLAGRDKAVYCTISRIDSKEGETFEVTWSDGHKNTLSYSDADLFDDIGLGDAGHAARHI